MAGRRKRWPRRRSKAQLRARSCTRIKIHPRKRVSLKMPNAIKMRATVRRVARERCGGESRMGARAGGAGTGNKTEVQRVAAFPKKALRPLEIAT